MAQALFRVEVDVKIAAQHIPHDDADIGSGLLQQFDLAALDAAVRRAKERRVQQSIGLLKVLGISGILRYPAFQVVKRVVTYSMAFSLKAGKYIGVLAHVIANAKKSGFGSILLQGIQHKRRNLGYGAVIKGKVQGAAVAGLVPQQLRVQLF